MLCSKVGLGAGKERFQNENILTKSNLHANVTHESKYDLLMKKTCLKISKHRPFKQKDGDSKCHPDGGGRIERVK